MGLHPPAPSPSLFQPPRKIPGTPHPMAATFRRGEKVPIGLACPWFSIHCYRSLQRTAANSNSHSSIRSSPWGQKSATSKPTASASLSSAQEGTFAWDTVNLALYHAYLGFAERKEQFLRAAALLGTDNQHEVILAAAEGDDACVRVLGNRLHGVQLQQGHAVLEHCQPYHAPLSRSPHPCLEQRRPKERPLARTRQPLKCSDIALAAPLGRHTTAALLMHRACMSVRLVHGSSLPFMCRTGSQSQVTICLTPVYKPLASHLDELGFIPGACGNCARQCNWSMGFLGGLPFFSLFHSGNAPSSPRFILIGFQDLNLKNFPNLITHPYALISFLKVGMRATIEVHVDTKAELKPVAIHSLRHQIPQNSGHLTEYSLQFLLAIVAILIN
ncbi:hypothetical protein PR048_028620 [Dryococelus australis]|uniref:Uncharacterized protein n=1 Tax=Dryococelus australis TaxID=614101 RepID=A0ABQ9GBS0_9NEOP|nr:hypothetical protein PR048_028620 [Dryococelus australis]